MDVSEDELLHAIRRVLSGAGPGVRVGVGDDAAVVAPGSGDLVLTTDVLVEGTHFTRGTAGPRDVGYKAIAVNVSDIAAMAASPRWALCALTLSDAVDAAWVMELLGGMREACDEYALWLVGGNLARGPEVTVAVTVTGEIAQGRALTRSGACVGDRIVVTGALGGSAAGLRLSATPARSLDAPGRAAIARHLRPVARVGEAGLLAGHGATALMDLSDGLAVDLGRLCEASGVGARLQTDQIPIAPGATLQEALSGGEDYELLCTLPEVAVEDARVALREGFGVALSSVGVVSAHRGLVAVGPDGLASPLGPAGWDHFRTSAQR
jgi:thiamine-monophosphate kinase